MTENKIQSQVIEELVGELGINNLPEDKRNELLIKMTEVLLKRIFVETMEKLGEEGRIEYEELMKNEASPEDLENFFREKITGYEDVVNSIVEEFKKEMLNVNKNKDAL